MAFYFEKSLTSMTDRFFSPQSQLVVRVEGQLFKAEKLAEQGKVAAAWTIVEAVSKEADGTRTKLLMVNLLLLKKDYAEAANLAS